MKYVLAVLGIVAIICVSVFCGFMWATVGLDANEEAAKTDDSAGAIQARLDAGVERAEQKHVQTITEVRYIRETVKTNVAAMDDDAVADGLNELTSRWRLEKSTGGVPGDGGGVSGDIAGRQGFAGGRGNLVSGKRVVAGSVQRPANGVHNDD